MHFIRAKKVYLEGERPQSQFRMRGYAMPTILLINDDGIQSIGLITLKKLLEKLGEVVKF